MIASVMLAAIAGVIQSGALIARVLAAGHSTQPPRRKPDEEDDEDGDRMNGGDARDDAGAAGSVAVAESALSSEIK